jgi:hypothetical protein
MKPLSLLAFALCASAALADVTGTWTGSARVEGGPEGAPTQVKAKPSKLELKADNTFVLSQTGRDDKVIVTTGKYQSNGKTLTLLVESIGGKPATGDAKNPRVYTLDKGGKSMWRDMSNAKVQTSVGGKPSNGLPDGMRIIQVFTKG